ncbi:LysM peptidoglycan-binding domain-containing protein [Methylophilus sp. TWE2]|uniref:LysM peptidoglycan-binding domain-containing protein n=1 Tax=Methylophilus sp. TWE2 TaxID=1662285 RepID=UPI0006708C76|nr:LysM peptidoglycan-binding domain-containing protein [Methylophilus sp. TWE2]AKR42299.1 peptidoglycan-binding protein LysM [Methylophilus sp. TWE2]
MTKIVQIITSLALACCSLLVQAEEIPLRARHPDRHVVVKGDTLWDISAKFLKNPWQWPQIWQLNRERIKNPHWIYPGDVIVLDTSSGKPVLKLVRESVTLEPGVIVTPIKGDAIPAIQPSTILPFLTKPMLISPEDLKAAPRIVAAQEEREILSPGTHIYVQGLPESGRNVWAIYREGEPVKDPETGELLGNEAHYLGEARLLRPGKPATLTVTQAKEEIAVKDKLIAVEDELTPAYIPHAPETHIQGQIARVSQGIDETGYGRVVVLNRGEEQGIERGHVLSVLRKGVNMVDPESDPKKPVNIQLPDEPVGLVMVFKTFPKLSYALVMQASQPIHTEDVVRTP